MLLFLCSADCFSWFVYSRLVEGEFRREADLANRKQGEQELAGTCLSVGPGISAFYWDASVKE